MKAERGQTLIDVAVQHCGSAEAAWAIAERNGLGLTDSPEDEAIELPTDGGDAETATAMAASGARPATDGEPARSERIPIGQIEIGRDKI